MKEPTDSLSRGGSSGGGDLTPPPSVNGPFAFPSPDAPAKLCQASEQRLLRFLVRHCHDWQLAQDLMQDVHEKVLRAIEKGNAPPDLMTIIRDDEALVIVADSATPAGRTASDRDGSPVDVSETAEAVLEAIPTIAGTSDSDQLSLAQPVKSENLSKAKAWRWLYKVARNTLIDDYRVQRRRPADPLDDHLGTTDYAFGSFETLDLLSAVRQILGDDEDKLEVFLRVCVYGEDPGDLAEERQAAGKTTLVTDKAIRQEIYRMRKRIRSLLRKYYPRE